MKIISLGLGVQSTALYYMSSLGELPRVDYAIFADTGREKKKTLEYLEYLQSWMELNNGIPIIQVTKRNLYTDLLSTRNARGKRFASIPAFTQNTDGSIGMLRRQCTSDYKIWQVDQTIRELYGKLPRQKLPPTEVWKGITLDEIERMSIPQEAWKVQVYPFIGYRITKNGTEKFDSQMLTRNDVVNWYHRHQLLVPPKSACTFCPYQSDAAWLNMKLNEPEDWQSAIEVDKAIRNSTQKGTRNPAYLHDSCKPLSEVAFNDSGNDLWKGECTDNCHI